jgi:hypothetical protein
MEEPMPDLKKISREAIPRAVTKAERYRLLNQSWATESICLDILEIDPDNQPVLVMLLLALTDQFGPEPGGLARRATALLERITDPYQRAYYSGIISERLGHSRFAHAAMHAEALALESLHAAMRAFERAEALRQPGNDDAILRWNTCVRTLAQHRTIEPSPEEYEPAIGE